MSTQSEHDSLRLPWELQDDSDDVGLGIVECGRTDGARVGWVDSHSGAAWAMNNAEFIVRACNAHHKALEALKAVERRMAHFTEHALFADSVAKEAIAHECNSLRGAASRAIAEMEG